jgi:hypothetical protein
MEVVLDTVPYIHVIMASVNNQIEFFSDKFVFTEYLARPVQNKKIISSTLTSFVK